jgi:hypothetical protein
MPCTWSARPLPKSNALDGRNASYYAEILRLKEWMFSLKAIVVTAILRA